MSKKLSPEEMNAVLAQDAEARYSSFLRQVVEDQTIWVLTDDEGCTILTADGDECIPVWPAAEYAALWIEGEWAECETYAVPLSVWMSRWAKGMEEDGLAVAVFPLQDGMGIVEAPTQLAESIRKYQNKGSKRMN